MTTTPWILTAWALHILLWLSARLEADPTAFLWRLLAWCTTVLYILPVWKVNVNLSTVVLLNPPDNLYHVKIKKTKKKQNNPNLLWLYVVKQWLMLLVLYTGMNYPNKRHSTEPFTNDKNNNKTCTLSLLSIRPGPAPTTLIAPKCQRVDKCFAFLTSKTLS